MGITLKMRREMVQIERDVIRNLRDDMFRMRRAMNQARLNIKMHQEVLTEERKLKRIVMEDQRALRAQKHAERAAARIAKAEARLQMLRDKAVARAAKATRKASPVTVWSPEQVAALNAANGAV